MTTTCIPDDILLDVADRLGFGDELEAVLG